MAINTQGQINWVSLSKSTVNFSIELLARFSRAGVEALTIAVGQALFKQFDIPADAQMRLQRSVSHLKAFSSVSDLLWFGVGYKHLMRTLLETEEGSSLVAVSSCLTVSYKSEYTAAVLKALCRKSSIPDSFTPSLSQWGAIANLCSPAVNASQFPLLVDGFSRLLIERITTTRPDEVLATSPDDLATALLELVPLTLGQVANLTMVGKADCAWLAALAVWLFSLRVEIIDHRGTVLYQSQGATLHAGPKSFQLTIIRFEDGQSSFPQALTRSRTHLVPPGNILFKRKTDEYHQFVTGRSEWKTLLTDAFNSSFKKLLEPETIPLFAQVLYSGLEVGETYPNRFCINPWGRTPFLRGDLQHQQRFLTMLSFAAARLPELASLEKFGRDHILELADKEQHRDRLSYKDEFRARFGHDPKGIRDRLTAKRFSDALVDACSCRQCKISDVGPSPSEIKETDHLCLSQISIAIFGLIWQISWLDIDDTLRPTSHAVRERYSVLLSAKEIRNMSNCPSMRDVVFLFSGHTNNHYMDASACSHEGVCVYHPSLEYPSTDVMSQLRLRVVSGQIEWGGKLFGSITENMNPWLRSKDTDPSLDRPDGDRTTDVMNTLGANPSVQIVIEETLATTDLSATFAVIPEGKSQVHWNYLYRPCLQSEAQVQPRGSCMLYGPWGLQTLIRSQLDGIDCRNTHKSTETDPLWSQTGSIARPWSGGCTFVDLPWWTLDPGAPRGLWTTPKPDEWVLAISNTEAGTLRLIRGTFSLLYCILARAVANEYGGTFSSLLRQAGDCLMCERGLPWENSQLQSLIIDCTINGRWQQLKFQPSLDRLRR